MADGVRQLDAASIPVLEQRILPARLDGNYFFDRMDGIAKSTSTQIFQLLKDVCETHIICLYLPRQRYLG